MLTGRQIREARETLGWSVAALARATRLPFESIARAERLDGGGIVPLDHLRAIRRALETAGVDFGAEACDPSPASGPRRRDEPPPAD